MAEHTPKVEHPETPLPIRLSDDELELIGAYIAGDITDPEQTAHALATVGMKVTGFFFSLARIAVEHHNRAVDRG